MAGILQLLDPFGRGGPEARPEGAGGRMVIGRPPQSRFETTLAVTFGPSRKCEWTGTAGTRLVLMDAPRIHHETTTRSLRAPGRQNRRSMGVSVEPEGGFEPPTCRLRGHRSPATMVEPGKVAQLRAADRQSRNHLINGGTLAETLAEQSELSRILHRFRLSDPMTGRLLEAQRRLVHCSSEDFGSRVERDSYDHPLWRACTSRTPADVCQYVAVGGRSMATTALQASRRSPARVSGR